MKKLILLLLLVACTVGVAFAQDAEQPLPPEMEDSGLGNKPVLIFGTIFVMVTLVLILRMVTEKMKTDKTKKKN
jgi:hypothetical protein